MRGVGPLICGPPLATLVEPVSGTPAGVVSRWASALFASIRDRALIRPRTLPAHPVVIDACWSSVRPAASGALASVPGDGAGRELASWPPAASLVAFSRPTGMQRRRRLLASFRAATLSQPSAA